VGYAAGDTPGGLHFMGAAQLPFQRVFADMTIKI